MTEIKLNQADKKRIEDDIRLTLILGLLFSIALIFLILIIPLILYLFGKTADGFLRRSLFIVGGLSLPFVAISWPNILRYIDLKKGMKINFSTVDYEVKRKKDGFVLQTSTPLNLELNVYDKLPDLIKIGKPVTIEIAKLSKTLLFISQADENLLEKIEREDS